MLIFSDWEFVRGVKLRSPQNTVGTAAPLGAFDTLQSKHEEMWMKNANKQYYPIHQRLLIRSKTQDTNAICGGVLFKAYQTLSL